MKLKPYVLFLLLIISQTATANMTEQQFPTPKTVSQALQPLVSGKPTPFWNDHPKTADEWRSWVNKIVQHTLVGLPALREKMQVTVEPTKLSNIHAFIVTPKTISDENKNND